MVFLTPLRISNGVLLDREWNRFPLRPRRTALPGSTKENGEFFRQCAADGINFVHLELDESLLTVANGGLDEKSAALPVLDDFMEQSYAGGIYLALTPVTRRIRIPAGRSEHAIRDDEPTFEERFHDALFSHVIPASGRAFYEYENIAAIEPIPCPECFTPRRVHACIHHLRAFYQHYFLNRLLEVWFCDRGRADTEVLELMDDFGRIQPIDIFPDESRLRYCSEVRGIRPAVFSAAVKLHDQKLYLPCAVSEAASQAVYGAVVHDNGGGEGWLSVESDSAVDLQLFFPCEVREALYRPSMRSSVPLSISGNTISFTLEKARYGVVEVNYNTPDLPHFTAYVFADPIIPAPDASQTLWLEPGYHENPDHGAAPVLAFKPGVHRFGGDRLRPISGHDIYLAPGAVLQCGLTCEDGKHIRIYGSGVFDGTRVKRMPGENWKGRADDAFIHFFKGQDIEWDGPVVFNSPFWNVVPEGTRDMVIRHQKALTWAANSDGIQPRSCVNLLIEKCFFKCADDSIAIKTRRDSGMHSENIVVRDVVTWNDAGSSLEIGHTSQADLLDNVRFENIEIVHLSSGVCHIYLIDHSTVENVVYENIYVDCNPFKAPEINFTISQNFYSTDDTRGRIRHIRIRNLHVPEHFYGIMLKGFDEDHRIEDVVVENVVIHHADGSTTTCQGSLPQRVLEHADPVVYKA